MRLQAAAFDPHPSGNVVCTGEDSGGVFGWRGGGGGPWNEVHLPVTPPTVVYPREGGSTSQCGDVE